MVGPYIFSGFCACTNEVINASAINNLFMKNSNWCIRVNTTLICKGSLKTKNPVIQV